MEAQVWNYTQVLCTRILYPTMHCSEMISRLIDELRKVTGSYFNILVNKWLKSFMKQQ